MFDAVCHTVLDALGKTGAPAALPQEARLPASRQDFFQTMDAKTFPAGRLKPAPARGSGPAAGTPGCGRPPGGGQRADLFYQTKRSGPRPRALWEGRPPL